MKLAAFLLALLPLNWENIFLKNSGAQDAALSPDGTWVAVAADTEEGGGIYRVSAVTPGPPERWASGRAPSWSPDSRAIAYLRDGDIWTVGVGSQEPRRVTHDAEDERAAVFSPDGKTIAFYSTRSGHQDVWLVPSDGSAAPRPLTVGAMAADDVRFAPAWSPDGRQVAFISNRNNYWEDDVWLADSTSGKARPISRGLMASSTPVWSPDGRQIALLGTAKDEYWYEDLAYIYVLDPMAGTERTESMQVYATDWLHNHRLFWSGDGKSLFFLYLERGDFNLWTVPAAGGIATRVSHFGGAVRSFHGNARGDAFVFVRTTSTRGAEVDTFSLGARAPVELTHFAQDWEHMQEPAEVSYPSFDGLYIQGFLYVPPDFTAGARYPALVNVHGGGTNSYLHGQNLIEQYLATRGYVVLAINYRGGSGFGRAFQELSVNDWANGQARDAAAAADFLRSLPYASGKVGIYGYSYGGIMTMATIARAPGKFDAAVPMAGIYDFADAYQNADRLGKIFIKTGHGGAPEERKETYAVSNTLARLQDIRTPLLIMHGEADVRAPFRQFQLAVALLKKHGLPFESHTYPGEPHGFRDPQNRIDMYRRLETFLDAKLKAR